MLVSSGGELACEPTTLVGFITSQWFVPLGDLTIGDLNTGFPGCPEVWVMPLLCLRKTYLQQHLFLLSH